MTGSNQRSVGSYARGAILVALTASVAACGGFGSGDSGLFGRRSSAPSAETADQRAAALDQRAKLDAVTPVKKRNTIWDIFGKDQVDAGEKIEVNKYLWQASLEVLNFLPVESVDPFSGVIVTGYGTPPGGGRSYRATIYVQDPALDARSLKVSLVTRGGGPVDAATARAVEDAILTRARQLRIRDGNL